jgi:hypothetical protein
MKRVTNHKFGRNQWNYGYQIIIQQQNINDKILFALKE